MKKIKNLIVIGAGGHARVVVDTAVEMGLAPLGILDTGYTGQDETILGYPVIGGLEVMDRFAPSDCGLAIAIGDNRKRSELFHAFRDKGFSFPALIHPTAVVSKHSTVRNGVLVNAGVVINAGADVGENSIVNTGAIVEHETCLGRHCHICPGVRIGGRVEIGDFSFVGIGSSIIDYVKVGHDSVIGAGGVIIDDVEPRSTYAGVPGKRIK